MRGVVEPEGIESAERQGLFVIVQSGETVRLANSPDFEPKNF